MDTRLALHPSVFYIILFCLDIPRISKLKMNNDESTRVPLQNACSAISHICFLA